MARLYCTVHGRGHENLTIARQEEYRQAGESVLIVHGTLRSPRHCDKCNAALRRGDAAMLITAYPRELTETMHEYDFTGEERCFDLARATLTRYGASWPGGEPADLLVRWLAGG